MFFSGPQIIGWAARKFFSIHKILGRVFQYSHCQDTGTSGPTIRDYFHSFDFCCNTVVSLKLFSGM